MELEDSLRCRPLKGAQTQLRRAMIDSPQAAPDRAVDGSQSQSQKADFESHARPEKDSIDEAEPQADDTGAVGAEAPHRAGPVDAEQAQHQRPVLDGAEAQVPRADPEGSQVQCDRAPSGDAANASPFRHSPDEHQNRSRHGDQQGAGPHPQPPPQRGHPRKR